MIQKQSFLCEGATVYMLDSIPQKNAPQGVNLFSANVMSTHRDFSETDRLNVAKLFAAAPDLLEALQFYMAICGNTAYSVTRESAMEAYAIGSAAIEKITTP